MLHYDKLLTSIGEFGYYQKRLCILLCILAFPNGVHITVVVFNNFTPDYRCAVPGQANDTYHVQTTDQERQLKAWLPYDTDKNQFSQCEVYDIGHNPEGNSSQREENITKECDRWVYDDSVGLYSVGMELDLVCDRALYKAHMNMALLSGILVGSLAGGIISDTIGRKTTTIISVLVQTLFGAGFAFAQSVFTVIVLRFIIISSGMMHFLALYVLLVETVGPSKRSVATMASMMGFTIGGLFMALVQFVFPNWRTAQLVISLPFLLFIVYWWLIEESPRWLITKKRMKEAKEVVEHIAKVNGVKAPIEMVMAVDAAVAPCEGMKHNDYVDNDDDDDDVDVDGGSVGGDLKLWHMCSNRRIAIRMSILSFSWICVNMVFYGLMLGVGDLIEGNIYVNFVLQAVMELISHMICIAILERTGRKMIYCSFMLTSGFSILAIAILALAQEDIRWLSVILYCIGKLCITLCFSLIYIMTTELLPTRIRNSGLGFCSFVARFSGIVSPYIVNASLLISGPWGKALPLLIFGSLSLLAGISAMWLPETRNTKLPETFDSHSKSGDTETENVIDFNKDTKLV